jgi:hypothetical protein
VLPCYQQLVTTPSSLDQLLLLLPLLHALLQLSLLPLLHHCHDCQYPGPQQHMQLLAALAASGCSENELAAALHAVDAAAAAVVTKAATRLPAAAAAAADVAAVAVPAAAAAAAQLYRAAAECEVQLALG